MSGRTRSTENDGNSRPSDAMPHTPRESSPTSPLRFIFTYECMMEQAEETAYAQQSTSKKVMSGIFYGLLAVIAVLLFMVAIAVMGNCGSLLLICHSRKVFLLTGHPLSAVAIGVITTALVHSGTTVTSLSASLVGAGVLKLRHGVFLVMGANIGTCVTAEMVAFGQAKDRQRFQRALGGALLDTWNNLWSVVVLFPLELLFHPLEKLSLAMASTTFTGKVFYNPVKASVIRIADAILKLKQESTSVIATNDACGTGVSFIESGLLSGISDNDLVVGGVGAALGLILFVVTLTMVATLFAKVFLGATKRSLSVMGHWNGYVKMLCGALIAFVMSSAAMTTSILTPLVGLDAFTLEQAYPVIVGANIGAPINTLIASVHAGSPDATALALVHVWFNVAGILLFYVVPITRTFMFRCPRSLAMFGASWIPTAVLFNFAVYYVGPIVTLLVISACRSSEPAIVTLGYVCAILIILGGVAFLVWYFRYQGRSVWTEFLERKRVEREIRKYEGNIGLPMFVDEPSM